MKKNRFLRRFRIAAIAGLLACEAEEAPEVEPDVAFAPVVPAPALAAAPAPAVGAVLMVAETPDYDAFIADADGRALYLLESGNPSEITCYDECAGVWPPFLAPQGTPTAGDPAVQAGLIGTARRRNGAMQVTYGGWPLYYYSGDRGTDRPAGQELKDAWGEWYLVTPGGEPLEGGEEGEEGS
jgi:predicted lipoprotein with Yx(FWY)xxD motif